MPIDYTHPRRKKSLPTVDLDAALATGVTTSRSWATPRSALAARVGSPLVLVEQPRFIDNDPENGMTAVMVERGHSGRSLLITDHGRRVTDRAFVDEDVSYAANGTRLLARRHTATALGLRPGGDFIQAHDPMEPLREGSPWGAVALLPRTQPYVGVQQSAARPKRAMFETTAVAVSPDGTRAAAVEFRGGSDRVLWAHDVPRGTWRTLTAEPETHYWAMADLAFSPDGEWLIVNGARPCLVRFTDGAVVSLDQEVIGVALLAAGWWPSAPGTLLGIGRSDGDRASLYRVALGAGTAAPVASLRGTSGLETGLVGYAPQVSADGRWLVLLAMVGLDPAQAARQGTGSRAFVVDLERFEAELVAPVFFGCGVERTVKAVRWVDQPIPSGGFELAEKLLATTQPAVAEMDPNVRRNRVRERHAGATQLLFDVVDHFGVNPWLVTEEIRRFSAGALEADPSIASAIESAADWAFARYVERGARREDPDGWLALSTDLTNLLAGRPMAIDG